MFKVVLPLILGGFCLSALAADSSVNPATESVSDWHLAQNAKMAAQTRYLAEASKIESWRTFALMHERQSSFYFVDRCAALLHLKFQKDTQSFGWSHVQLGYGDIFPLTTITNTRSNGGGWEEPNYAYFKYHRSF